MARYDDLNIRAIAVVGFISCVLVVAIVIGLQALFHNYERDLATRRPADTRQSDNLIAEQESRLRQKGWINREEGTVAIPIDQAMEIVVQELRRQQIELEQ